jgi:hypothetical protein
MLTPRIEKPGVYEMHLRRYLADPCPEPSLNTGTVAALSHQSPLHAYHQHPRLGAAARESATRADIGSAIHAKVLGGAPVVYLAFDDWRTNAAQRERDEAYTAGSIPLLSKHEDMVEDVATSATKFLEKFLEGSEYQAERTLVWRHEGAWCRSRPDIIVPGKSLAIDIKTCSVAAPAEWIRRSLWSSDYDVQAALICNGLHALTGRWHDFLFLAVEIEPPYACSLIGVGPTMVDIANAKVDAAAKLWRRCLDEESWPGYGIEIVYAEAPSWAIWQHEQVKQGAA